MFPFRVILALLLLTVGRNAFSQTYTAEEKEKLISDLIKLGENEESSAEFRKVVTRIENVIIKDLKGKGTPDAFAGQEARDSALIVIKKYFSFNDMFLRTQFKKKNQNLVSKNSIMNSRRAYADSLSSIYKIKPFFPLLDSFYESRFLKIEELTKVKY